MSLFVLIGLIRDFSFKSSYTRMRGQWHQNVNETFKKANVNFNLINVFSKLIIDIGLFDINSIKEYVKFNETMFLEEDIIVKLPPALIS